MPKTSVNLFQDTTVVGVTVLASPLSDDILYHESCQGETEDSRYMNHRAVGLSLAGQGRVFVGVADCGIALVVEYFGREHAEVLLGGECLLLPHTLAHSRRQRTAVDLPKLCYADSGEVELQSAAHR